MALRTHEVIQLKPGLVLGITDGPNDWDLWLSLRGTIGMVTFFVDQQISIPPFPDPRTFLDGTIVLLDRDQSRFSEQTWKLRGRGNKGNTRFSFEATYNSNQRKGLITVLWIG